MDWIERQVRFDQSDLQAAFLDYVHEVEHAADRLERLEKAGAMETSVLHHMAAFDTIRQENSYHA
jgi:hypothetical protein